MDQDLRPPLDEGLQLLVAEGGETHRVVEHDERRRRDQTSGQRVVAAVHRVLDRVREDEEQDEVERRELAHLAFAGEPQHDDEEEVDEDRAKDQLPPVDGWDPELFHELKILHGVVLGNSIGPPERCFDIGLSP